MKRIFELTKPEQRVVILIVAALVAVAFLRHWFETRSHARSSTTLIASPTATPTALPTEEQSDSEE